MRWVLVVVSVLAMVAAGCSGDDDDTASDASSTTVVPATTVTEAAAVTTVEDSASTVEAVEVLTTTVPPAAVIEGAFTFADDDLCEWVSEDKVAEFVAAESEWDGTAVLEGASEPEDPDSCQWRVTSTAGDAGDVSAGNASTWDDFNGNPYDFGEVEVVAFDEVDLYEGFVQIRSAVSGHPSLSDGVVVHSGGFGQYAFWVPPGDEYLTLGVSFGDVGAYDDADNEARLFGVADRFVQELGWLG